MNVLLSFLLFLTVSDRLFFSELCKLVWGGCQCFLLFPLVSALSFSEESRLTDLSIASHVTINPKRHSCDRIGDVQHELFSLIMYISFASRV